MNYKKPIQLFIVALLGVTGLQAQTKQATITGPDGHVKLQLSIKDAQLSYSITKNGHSVIETSSLGLTVGQKEIGKANGLGLIKKHIVNETYAWRGVHSKAVDHCIDATIPIKGADGSPAFTLEARVYDNGVAFRYLLSATGNSEITADNTCFTIPAGSTAWSQGDIGSYEGKYQQQEIEDIKEGQLVGPPLTVKLPGENGYLAITEGGVTNFAGISLKADGSRGFKANMKGSTNLTGNIATPWRIVEIGDLNTLVNCDIIANVSPKPDKTLFPEGFATPWIQPGKSVWSWLAGNGGVTFENMKKYSKWASELGITYNLVDEGWSRWKDGDKDKWTLIKELVDYSNQLNVKVWVWKAYPDRGGVSGLKDPEARRTFFNQCKEAGVSGLKIDFFDTELQEVLNFYQEALKDAAKLHLMLDFHGADKPTGQGRTWPNEMSREGIRGLENKTNWPRHNATLIFTRYLAGHGDYTPLSFRDIVKGTTLTHQLATVAAFTSPFMCLAVNPEALLASDVKSIVKDIPVVWDETVVLPQSKIGELAVLARRSGKVWYLTALNGETAQSIKVDLKFLGEGSYKATTLEDVSDDASKTNIKTTFLNKGGEIDLNMSAGGGFLAVISK
ncbi:MAG: Retaining alpha-galactosidase precursor [Mucilaginibacter sp.]|nr:Retaining alpha-galactosidase precursor [Mucilaginibacter sp.]